MRLWDLATARPPVELRHTSSAALGFSADNQLLATLDDEGVVRVWSLATGQQLFRGIALSERGLLGWANGFIVAIGGTSAALLPI